MSNSTAACEQTFNADDAEAAQVLQRAVGLSVARFVELEDCKHARDSVLLLGVYWTSQPEQYQVAFHNKDTVRFD